MTKEEKKTIERAYKDMNDLVEEAERLQELIDNIKDANQENIDNHFFLTRSGNSIDMLIKSAQEANEYLLKIE